MNPILKLTGYLGWGAVVLMLAIMPLALISRNLEPIKLTNTRLVETFAGDLERNLPASRSLIMGDNPAHLCLLRAHLLRHGKAQDSFFYDTTSAILTDYHSFLHSKRPEWPKMFTGYATNSQIAPSGAVMLLNTLATNLPLYYIQPSFGYYFERFQLGTRGITYPLSLYATNQLFAAPPTADVVKENQEYWSDFDSRTLPLLKNNLPSENLPPMPSWQAKIYTRLHLSKERVLTAELLAAHYSRASVYWGVELQKLGKWEEAAACFERALTLNPDNVTAQINLDYNVAHRKGEPPPTNLATAIEDRFGKYRSWNEVLADCGPFDEPRFTFEQSRTFLQGRLHRQALHQMKRVTQLEPHNFVAQIWLADLYTMLGRTAETLDIVELIRRDPVAFGLTSTNELAVTRIECSALFRAGERDSARAKLAKAVARPEADGQFRVLASQLFLQNSLFADALPLLQRATVENPSDLMSLANYGFALLQLGKNEEAKVALEKARELDPKNNIVRLNLAIAFLRMQQFDPSQELLDPLLIDFPNSYPVLFALGEISAAKGDANRAKEYFEKCLKMLQPGSREYLDLTSRLEKLKAK